MVHRVAASIVAAGVLIGCQSQTRLDPIGSGGASGHEPGVWAIAVHAARAPQRDDDPSYVDYAGRIEALAKEGGDRLIAGESAVDVVEFVVRELEADRWFDAGRGAGANARGQAQLGAAIVDGSTLEYGAVAGFTESTNPISLARVLMGRSHTGLVAGDEADRRFTELSVPGSEPPEDMPEFALFAPGTFPDYGRWPYGSVGCVALDTSGRLAVANSGGAAGRSPGAVDASVIIGAGIFANDIVAISCIGPSDAIVRRRVASAIAARMELLGESVFDAVRAVVIDGPDREVTGVVAVTRSGQGFVVGVDRAEGIAIGGGAGPEVASAPESDATPGG